MSFWGWGKKQPSKLPLDGSYAIRKPSREEVNAIVDEEWFDNLIDFALTTQLLNWAIWYKEGRFDEGNTGIYLTTECKVPIHASLCYYTKAILAYAQEEGFVPEPPTLVLRDNNGKYEVAYGV